MRDIDFNYVTVEAKKIKINEKGELHEITEKITVPTFVAEILTGLPASVLMHQTDRDNNEDQSVKDIIFAGTKLPLKK